MWRVIIGEGVSLHGPQTLLHQSQNCVIFCGLSPTQISGTTPNNATSLSLLRNFALIHCSCSPKTRNPSNQPKKKGANFSN